MPQLLNPTDTLAQNGDPFAQWSTIHLTQKAEPYSDQNAGQERAQLRRLLTEHGLTWWQLSWLMWSWLGLNWGTVGQFIRWHDGLESKDWDIWGLDSPLKAEAHWWLATLQPEQWPGPVSMEQVDEALNAYEDALRAERSGDAQLPIAPAALKLVTVLRDLRERLA